MRLVPALAVGLLALAAPAQAQSWDVTPAIERAVAAGELATAGQLLDARVAECAAQAAVKSDCGDLHIAAAAVAVRRGDAAGALRLAKAGMPLVQATLTPQSGFGRMIVLIEIQADAREALGELAEAEQALGLAILFRRGVEDDKAALLQTRRGQLLAAQARYRDAEVAYRAALVIYQKILPDGHPWLGTAYNNLGANLVSQRRHQEAAPLLALGLAIRTKALGERHAEVAASHLNVAANLEDMGDLTGAADHYRKALDIYRAILPPDSPLLAVCYQNFAGNLIRRGKEQEAVPLLRAALGIVERSGTGNRRMLALARNNLARSLLATGEVAQAERLARLALDEAWRWYPISDPQRIAATALVAELAARRAEGGGESRTLYRHATAGALARLAGHREFGAAEQADMARYAPLFRSQIDALWRLAE